MANSRHSRPSFRRGWPCGRLTGETRRPARRGRLQRGLRRRAAASGEACGTGRAARQGAGGPRWITAARQRRHKRFSRIGVNNRADRVAPLARGARGAMWCAFRRWRPAVDRCSSPTQTQTFFTHWRKQPCRPRPASRACSARCVTWCGTPRRVSGAAAGRNRLSGRRAKAGAHDATFDSAAMRPPYVYV